MTFGDFSLEVLARYFEGSSANQRPRGERPAQDAQKEATVRSGGFRGYFPVPSQAAIERLFRWGLGLPMWVVFLGTGLLTTAMVGLSGGAAHGDLWQAAISPFGLWGLAGLTWAGWQRVADWRSVRKESPRTTSFPARTADGAAIGQEGGWSAQEKEDPLAHLSERLRSTDEASRMP